VLSRSGRERRSRRRGKCRQADLARLNSNAVGVIEDPCGVGGRRLWQNPHSRAVVQACCGALSHYEVTLMTRKSAATSRSTPKAGARKAGKTSRERAGKTAVGRNRLTAKKR
jgi:hypothetical protein